MPLRAAGAGADSVATGVQLERDVGVDANDRRAAVDHVVLQAGARARARARASPSSSGATAPARRGARPGRSPGRISSWGLTASSSGSTGLVPAAWRRPAVRAAHRWMLEHCENTDGLGAIFPPMVYSIIALRCLDYDLDSPAVSGRSSSSNDLQIVEGDRVRVQPCLSPVWDTAIATISLADAGLPSEHPAWKRAVDWLLDKEVRNPGDWQIDVQGSSPRAGTSSSTTRSIPTSTIARWCSSAC